MMRKILLGVAAVLALVSAVPAAATTIHPNSALIRQEGPRGTLDNRNILTNALGAPDGTFFELGYGAIVDFYFAQPFRSPNGTVVEITNGNRDAWLEGVRIIVGNTVNGIFQQITVATPDPLLNTGNGVFTFAGGSFDTIRLIDVTLNLARTNGNRGPTGGFDVESISVTAVPLPAGGLLLLGGLAGLAALRRRKARAV